MIFGVIRAQGGSVIFVRGGDFATIFKVGGVTIFDRVDTIFGEVLGQGFVRPTPSVGARVIVGSTTS